MNIEITCSEVKTCGSEILECSSNFDGQIKNYNSIVDSINTIWDGVDAAKYIATLRDNYITTLNQIKGIFDQYGEFLQNVPDPYETLDEAYAAKTIDI